MITIACSILSLICLICFMSALKRRENKTAFAALALLPICIYAASGGGLG